MTNTKTIARLIGAIAIAVFVTSCSDGELQLGGGANITPPPPVILKFEANPAQVAKGGSTTLYWEVEEADSVEIAAAPEGIFQFHAGPFEEISGSTVVDGITDTTDFILTASKTVMVATPADTSDTPAAFVIHKAGQIPLPGEPAAPALNPQTVTAQATITVVIVGSECSIDITADSSSINAGDSTMIRWTAAPDTVPVTVTASDGTPVADTFPAVGNATVTPASTTTYTASVTCPDGQTKTDEITVQVNNSNIRATVLVNGMKNPTVSSLTEPVEVTWTATPANAKVTVNASPAATCEPALPNNVESASGTASCTLTGTTSFTVHAAVGTEYDDDDATATLVGGSVNLNIKADPWAFVSEEVEIEVQADAETVSSIDKLEVGGTSVNKTDLVAGVTIKARVPNLQGVPVTIHRIGVLEPEVRHPIQNIIPMLGHQFFHGSQGKALPVTRITVDNNDASRFYYGVQREEFGEISVYRLNNFADSMELAQGIDIQGPIKSAFDLGDLWQNNNFFSNFVKTFPVNAIAVKKSDAQVIFAGTTGAIMYTKNGGATDEDWKALDIFFYARRDGYTGSHKSCAGKMQTGISNAPNAADIATMGQICDMIAKADGRLIVAYDRGIIVTEDAEKHAAKASDAPWIGARAEDTNGVYSRDGSKVAHDLEEVGSKIFAATNSGVYVNEDGTGIGWTQFAGGAIDSTKAVYSLAFDAKSNKIFAGTDDGVYVSDKDTANWVKTEGPLAGPVLSLAVDPVYNEEVTGPVVLAGTATGMAVTRNGGRFWSVLNSPEATDLREVRSVAVAAIVSGSKVTYKVSAAGNGYAAGIVEVGATAPTEPSSSFRAWNPVVTAMPISH